MEIVLLAARIFLALIFGIAGIVKLTDTAGFRRTLIDFGVPEKLAALSGWSLPVVEIIVAAALLPLASAWWGAVAALALLLIFAVGIGINLSRGQAPDCNCFGQLHSEPVSWSLFTRDLLMAAVAAFVVIQGKTGAGLSAFIWFADLKTAEIGNLVLGLIALGLLATAVVFLRRVLNNQATVLAKIEAMKKVLDEDYAEVAPLEHRNAAAPTEGLPIGAPAPGFSLPDISGGQVTLEDLLAYKKSVLLLFVSPNCAPCKALLPVAREWEREFGDRLIIALVSKGTVKENQDRVANFGIRKILLQGESNVAENYQAKWTPAAVLINPEGRIASQVLVGQDAISEKINRAFAAGRNANDHLLDITVGKSQLKYADPAPSFSLPDLQGNLVDAQDLRGRDTILLFWDPNCPFCKEIAEDLKGWEERQPEGAPRLVLITSGNEEDARAKMGDFKSLVLLDPEFEAAPLFGSNNTPSAILLDSKGRISSVLAVGSPNVLALAGIRKVELPIASSFGRVIEPQPSRIQ